MGQSVQWMGYRLDDEGLIHVRDWDFFRHCVQAGSGGHLAFYKMGTDGPFRRNKVTKA